MQTIFNDDFQAQPDGAYPHGWAVERHSDLSHDLAEVRRDALRILFPGNLHLPLMPPIREGVLKLTMRGDVYSASAVLRILFRYDPQTRSGYCIRHTWGVAGMSTAFGICRNREFTTLASVESDKLKTTVANEVQLRLECAAHEFAWFHQDQCLARFADPDRTFGRPGLIALDRGVTKQFYICDVLNVHITSDEPESFKAFWPERVFDLPADLNGLTDPWCFKVRAVQSPHRTKIEAEIFGGPGARQPVMFDPRGLRGNSRLTRPYARVESGLAGDVPRTQYLHSGSLGLKEHWAPRSSGDLPCDSEGPARRTLWFDDLPADAWLALGYKRYEAEDRLALAGGPAEMLVCPKTGEIIYAGPALDPGALVLEIHSPPDKKIVGMIPADEVRRDQALAFARNNHFFFESEPVSFTVQLRHRQPDLQNADLALWIVWEDAFQSPLAEDRRVDFCPQIGVVSYGAVQSGCGQVGSTHARKSVDDQRERAEATDELSAKLHARMGVTTLTAAPVDFAGLKAGVYHLRVELRRGAQTLLSLRRAFEVMADDPAALPPPLVSGLPDLIPQIPDYATATGAFDPWVGRGVDAMHYLANCSHHILPARVNRIWDLVHLYRRRWVVELQRRMTPDPAPEANADVVQYADRVYWNQRHDLWHGGYDKVVLAALIEFLRQNPAVSAVLAGADKPMQPAVPAVNPGGDCRFQDGETCLDADVIEKTGALTVAMYRELLTRHWKAWVEFFNQWMLAEHVPAMHARLRAVNPKAEWVTYGIYPPYGSAYKGAYFARYTGRDLRNGFERFYDGPMLLEDYPYMCGYPLQRAVFMLTAMKLEAPKLKQYPEVYGVNGCADDSRPVYGMPPYAHSHTPTGFFRKTVFEYACAAVWFAADSFHYWNDNGFQAMAWTAAHYDAVVRTWGILKKHPPAKPLRTTAFAVSRAACLAHPDIFTETRINPDFEGRLYYHDVVNTAEENTAFAYEEARQDGQSAGFLLELADIAKLDPADAHTLVVPPLSGISAECQAAIRRLHERGVALIGFEEPGDLADLFGVRRRAKSVRLDAMRVADDREEFWRTLPAGSETCETPHCIANYEAVDAETIITGMAAGDANGENAAPVLVCRRTQWGRAAFFNIPPTMVKRMDLKYLVSYGKESRSPLMNRAMALALRWVGRPAVETTAGKLIAFYDQHGQINVIVMEDAHPALARPIRPVVTIRHPDLDPASIKCDDQWYLVERHPEYLCIGLELLPHDSAHMFFE